MLVATGYEEERGWTTKKKKKFQNKKCMRCGWGMKERENWRETREWMSGVIKERMFGKRDKIE